MRKFIWSIVLAFLLLSSISFAQIDPWKNRYVISVPDGDTLVLDNGEVVKLIGLSSPLAKHGKKEGQNFGDQARALTEEMLLGKRIEISFDKAYRGTGHRDQYGRALIYATTSGIEKTIANIELLKLGVGFYTPASEDLSIDSSLKSAESEARKHKVGVWANTDKSPVEIAESEGKAFQPSASLNLIYVRPSTPILQGPGVSPTRTTDVAINNNQSNSDPSKRPNAMDMEDLRKTNVNPTKKPDVPKNDTPQEDLSKKVYSLRERLVFFSTYEGEQKLELYKATSYEGEISFRIGVKQDNKEVIFITNYDGLKELQKLLNKGTESQPTLTAVQSSVGSFSGQHGTNISISTGKDGGLFLSVTGKDGTTRFFLNRQSALKMQIAIDNV